MGVLASLLPGVRHIRTPLVSGYLWLLSLWLFFGDSLPSKDTASGPLARLYELDGLLSDFGSIAALSFSAYVLGSIIQPLVELVLKEARGKGLSHALYKATLVQWLVDALEEAEFTEEAEILQMKLELVPSPSEQMPTGLMAPLKTVDYQTIAATELPQLPSWSDSGRLPDPQLTDDYEILRARLMATQGTLYGEYDRLVAEAEFRVGIAVPLTIIPVAIWSAALNSLSVFIIFILSWSSLMALVVLLLQGFFRQGQADLALVSSVSADIVTSPYSERVKVRLKSAQQQRL